MNQSPKIKKGEIVLQFRSWDNKGLFCIEPLRIESWGKKQATAHSLVTERMTKRRIYSGDYSEFMLASECPDPYAEGKKRAAEWVATEIARLKELVGKPTYHQPSILGKLAVLEAATPRAEDYSTLLARISERGIKE